MTVDPLRMSRFTGLFHALLRIVTGLLFLEHGTMKLLDFPPSEMKMPPGPMLYAAGGLELIGGALIVIGLFTRPVAFLLSGQMAIAYWLVHAPQGPFPAVNMGELAILYCFIFLWLSAAGSGPWALDSRSAR